MCFDFDYLRRVVRHGHKLVLSSWQATGWRKGECDTSLNILAQISHKSFHRPQQAAG